MARRRRPRRRWPRAAMILGNAGQELTYDRRVLSTNPFAYWPQSETTGLVATCLTNTAMNGTYTGVTLADDNTGPFGTPAPLYDGTSDYLNIQTAAFMAAFNGSEGSMMTWSKVYNVGVWSDATRRDALYIVGAAGNWANIRKDTAANDWMYQYQAGAVFETIHDYSAPTAWAQSILTWSASADNVIAYLNGAQVGSPSAVLGTWAGPISKALIGASSVVPANVWYGWLGPCAVWDRRLTVAEVENLYVT